jgi:hypothetical protein
MEATPQSNIRTVRIAASLFIFVCLPMALWDQSYVPKRIFVAQDPVATATNLLANETIFRVSILSHLLGIMIFASMIFLFARVFSQVDKTLARLMCVAVLMTIPCIFILELFNYSALMVLKSETRDTFNIAQQQESAYFLIRIYRYGIGPGLGKLFLGLCFIPFGMVVLRSNLAPRAIGILLLIGGLGYIVDCCISVLLQRNDYVMVRTYLMWTTLAYFAALIWFLVKGVREPVNITSSNL